MHTLFLWLRTLLNLDFTGGFNMAFPFESDIESFSIFGCGFGGGFFMAGGLPSLSALSRNASSTNSSFLANCATLRKSKGKNELRSGRRNARVQLEIPEVTTRGFKLFP